MEAFRFYDWLAILQNADEATIKTAYFEKYKIAEDAASRKILNKAKDCLTNFVSRTAYNEALAKYKVKDGDDKRGDLQELLPVPTDEEELPTVAIPTTNAAAVTEYPFEVSFQKEITAFMASDLESLNFETSEALALRNGSFQLTYENKGKRTVVRTQAVFKMMVSKPPNADGCYEVSAELLEQTQDKPVAAQVEEEEKKYVQVPEYKPPPITHVSSKDSFNHF